MRPCMWPPNTETWRHRSILPSCLFMCSLYISVQWSSGAQKDKTAVENKLKWLEPSMQREKVESGRGWERERWIFLLYCPPVMKRSSGVFMVRKTCSVAVSPLVSKTLGDKRCVCMGLCVKASEHAHTHIVCLLNVFTPWWSYVFSRLHRDLFLFFSPSSGRDSCPRSVCTQCVYMYINVCECFLVGYTVLASEQQTLAGIVDENEQTYILFERYNWENVCMCVWVVGLLTVCVCGMWVGMCVSGAWIWWIFQHLCNKTKICQIYQKNTIWVSKPRCCISRSVEISHSCHSKETITITSHGKWTSFSALHSQLSHNPY